MSTKSAGRKAAFDIPPRKKGLRRTSDKSDQTDR